VFEKKAPNSIIHRHKKKAFFVKYKKPGIICVPGAISLVHGTGVEIPGMFTRILVRLPPLTKSFDRSVRLENGAYGRIERIFCFQRNVFVILRRVEVEQGALRDLRGADAFSLVQMCNVYPYGDSELVHASCVVAKCTIMNVPPRTYIAAHINVFEGD